jgi:hypothetical protein
MIRLKFCVFLLLSASAVPGAHSQHGALQNQVDARGPKAVLKRGSAFYGYPGSMAFHTAFHRGITTRYLLLKTATELPALRDYLALNDQQIGLISELRPVEVDISQDDHANAIVDPNAEPDENVVDPDYFRFLSDDQLNRLDLVALALDGYPALARSSVAERLELSPMTRTAIAAVLRENRTEIFLPRFRANFAGKLPSDHEYRDSVFAGQFLAHLNHEIIEVLAPQEAKRLTDWLMSAPTSDDAIEAVFTATPFPNGLNALASRWDPLRKEQKDEQ